MNISLKYLVKYGLPKDHNWNSHNIKKILPNQPNKKQLLTMKIVDEGLRDGLAGASRYPNLKEMITYTNAVSMLGIDTMTVGIYPGNNGIVGKTIKELLRVMANNFPQITPIILSLTTPESIRWAGECKKINSKLQAIIFMGTAPFRLLVEDWSEKQVLDKLSRAVKQAIEVYGIEVIGATEHTTQTQPNFLKKIIKTVVCSGAKYFCIADTIGNIQPVGTYQVVKFVKQVLNQMGRPEVKIDWHGHRDTGNELQNAMMALAAGADRIHAVPGGFGERAGNTPMEAIIINCVKLLKDTNRYIPWNMKELTNVLDLYRKMVCGEYDDHGLLGKRAFYTSLGIHGAAYLKALELAKDAENKGYKKLALQIRQHARTIYTAIDPESVGRHLEFGVGPWSGKSNVILAAMIMGMDINKLSEEIIIRVLKVAKEKPRDLTEEELKDLLTI